METTVERIRRYCKEKGVAVSVLEKDLGFGNGYLNPKKIDDVNTDRLLKILDYLGVSAEEFFDIGSKQTQIIETAIVQAAKKIPNSAEYDKMGIVSKFNALDAHGKQIVLALLDAEYERCTRNVIDLNDVTMVARSGKKMDEATKADAQKMAEIIFGDKE